MLKTPKSQVLFISLSTLLAGFSLGCIINFTDPYTASALTKSFFFISLFLVSLGFFTILGLFLRQWLWPKLYVINLNHSFRQGLLVSILVVASFLLLAQHVLFWWVELTLILFLASLEAFLNLKI